MSQVSDVLTRVRDILSDTDSESWTDDELIRWLNDGVRRIGDLKPSALSRPIDVALAAGPQQVLPAALIHLVGFVGIVSSDGLTHYKAVTKVPLEQLDREVPDWRNDNQSPSTQHVMVDENDHQTFWVYPPADGTRSLRILGVETPAELTATTDALPFRNDQYVAPAVDYVVYRALMRDADEGPERARAIDHFQQFAGTLVGQQEARRMIRDESEATA